MHWRDVLANKPLQDLPYKTGLKEWGSNQYVQHIKKAFAPNATEKYIESIAAANCPQ